jgi:F-type H+-transporting ATPase subunit alpha
LPNGVRAVLELLKQLQYSPYAIWQMYASLYAATQGCFDKVPLEKIKLAEEALHRELKGKHAKLIEALNTGDKPTDVQNDTILKVAKAIAETYKETNAAKADKEQ